MIEFDDTVHKILQDVGGDSLAPSLARALDGSHPTDSHLFVVSLSETLRDFLQERVRELNQARRLESKGKARSLTPEDVLADLVEFYADQARW